VLDDFVVPEIAAACRREFPPLEGNGWIHYTHFNERKFGKSDRETFPPALAAVVDEFNSPRFLRFLETLTGIAGLLPTTSSWGPASISRPAAAFSTSTPTSPAIRTAPAGAGGSTCSCTERRLGRRVRRLARVLGRALCSAACDASRCTAIGP
jgi:hypothetical protein